MCPGRRHIYSTGQPNDHKRTACSPACQCARPPPRYSSNSAIVRSISSHNTLSSIDGVECVVDFTRRRFQSRHRQTRYPPVSVRICLDCVVDRATVTRQKLGSSKSAPNPSFDNTRARGWTPLVALSLPLAPRVVTTDNVSY